MTDSPRWERESELDTREPETEQDRPAQVGETAEFDAGVAVWEDDDADDRAPRLAAARESFGASLSATRRSLETTGRSLSSGAGRVGRWVASLDRRPEFDGDHGRHDPVAALNAGEPAEGSVFPGETASPMGSGAEPETSTGAGASLFATAPLGYNRQAVEARIADLEAELATLREAVDPPPMSINEEIERLGEQTASILVVAHDKAHETARRAQEQAARAVREASDDAERITVQAQLRLRELDEETDAVWRERERLLEDVREVSRTLMTLADAASERFPAAETVGRAGRPEAVVDDEPDAGVADEADAETAAAPARGAGAATATVE